MSNFIKPHTSYDGENFAGQKVRDLRDSQFENCSFVDVDFAEALLQGVRFLDCRFESCDLSRVNLSGAQIQGVSFESCRLMGINWSAAAGLLLAFSFVECNASYSIFHGVNLRSCRFSTSKLTNSEFQKSNLSGLSFEGCDFSGALMNGSRLYQTDFSGAHSVFIDPSRCLLKDTKLDIVSALGVLKDQGIVVS
jgi:fluoroquinolone resistance protein